MKKCTVFLLVAIMMGNSAYSKNSVSNSQSWALATSALLTEINRQNHFTLGGSPINPKQIKRWKKVLYEGWEIDSREELLRTLNYLYKEGHRKSFAEHGKIPYFIE